MFESELVDKRFQAFLQQQCELSGHSPVQMSEPEAAWFLEQLALHATYGLFVGTGIYWRFGCPSTLMQEVERLVGSSQRLTGKSFVDVVLASFRESNTNWRVLAESELPELRDQLSAAVASGKHDVFPAELLEAAREVHAATQAKRFTAPRPIQEALAGVEGLLDESLTLLTLAASLSPGLTFERTNSGGYVAEGDGWISFKSQPERGQLLVVLLGAVSDYQVRAELPLRKSDNAHVSFALSEAVQMEAAQDYVRQAARLRAAE